MPLTIAVCPLPGFRWALRRWRYRVFGYPPGLERASLLNYVLWRCWKAVGKPRGFVDMRYYRLFVYAAYRNLKEQGLDCKLPHYWYVDGPVIEWTAVNEVINSVGYMVTVAEDSVNQERLCQKEGAKKNRTI